MDRKIRSKAAQGIGQIKGARGMDCFLLRDLKKVSGEWPLMATTHTIGKLHRAALAAS